MMPTSLSRGIAVLVAVLVVSGCSTTPSSSGDLDLRTGCSWVIAERSNVGAQVVMDVRATDCRDTNGQLLVHDLAASQVARAVWQTLDLPVDAVRVTVSEVGTSATGVPTTIPGDELAERFGPGPPGVAWPVSDPSDESIWVVLPVAYVAAGLAMVMVVRRLRDAGLVVVLLRR